MITLTCTDCQHHLLLPPTIRHAFCQFCGAEYEVTVTQVRKSPLDEEKLKEKQNSNRG